MLNTRCWVSHFKEPVWIHFLYPVCGRRWWSILVLIRQQRWEWRHCKGGQRPERNRKYLGKCRRNVGRMLKSKGWKERRELNDEKEWGVNLENLEGWGSAENGDKWICVFKCGEADSCNPQGQTGLDFTRWESQRVWQAEKKPVDGNKGEIHLVVPSVAPLQHSVFQLINQSWNQSKILENPFHI